MRVERDNPRVRHPVARTGDYFIAVDGYDGSETEWAVEEFQSGAGLTVDGIVGPTTWQALVDLA